MGDSAGLILRDRAVERDRQTGGGNV